MKKILASVAAAALAVSAMSVASFAADTYTANLGAQFDPTFNEDIGEWTDDATATIELGKEVTVTYDFGTEKVKLGGNYLGIKTDIPWSTEEGAENPTVVVSAVKVDGNDVAFDASKVFLGDNDSNNGHLKITLINEWGDIPGAPAVDYEEINGTDGFSTLAVTFTVTAAAPATTESSDTTTAGGNGATDGNDEGDKNTPNSGIEGVAVVAGLAIVAAGAVVVAKKRK